MLDVTQEFSSFFLQQIESLCETFVLRCSVLPWLIKVSFPSFSRYFIFLYVFISEGFFSFNELENHNTN